MNTNTNENLVLITESYPLGAVTESFLDLEIPYLSKAFDSVIIIPCSLPVEIERIERKLPANISVDISHIRQKSQRKSLEESNVAFNVGEFRYPYPELFRRSNILLDATISTRRAIYHLYDAIRVRNWILRHVKQNNFDLTRTVFYTYWISGATMGVGLAKRRYSKIKLVSRAHGGDIYEERHSPPYLPFRLPTLAPLDRLYLISEHGRSYITKKYPHIKSKLLISRLGVRATGFLSEASSDGVFRVISCSSVVPVKRIQLIISGLKELGLSRPNLEIEWIHIGSGPLLDKIETYAISQLPENVTSKFLGFLPNPKVLSYYKHNPIDIFINVSASEGVPVAIMEAQSCGIPVVATAVGGTPEIVSEKVGALLGENPSPKEIANALGFVVDHPDIAEQLRSNCVKNWRSHYDADKNFTDFANSLKTL